MSQLIRLGQPEPKKHIKFLSAPPVDVLPDVLQKVKNLLVNTDLTVTEIAMDQNFDSETELIQVFQENENMTPTEYRSESKLPAPQANQVGFTLPTWNSLTITQQKWVIGLSAFSLIAIGAYLFRNS